MRTITIRQLSINLFKELENLPFEVTRYGKPYCRILKLYSDEELAKKKKEFSTPVKSPGEFKQEFTGPIPKESQKSPSSSVKPRSTAFVRPRGEMDVDDYV